MASSAFAAAVAATKQSKNLDTVLAGSRYFDAGVPCDVVIQAVDTSDVENDRIAITCKGEGKTWSDKLFLLDQEGGLGFQFRQLLGGVLPNLEALDKLLSRAATDPHALEVLTGMHLRLVFKHGKGCEVRATGNGMFSAYMIDGKGVDQGPVIGEFATVDEARSQMKAAGHKSRYLKIDKVEATAAEANLAAFNSAAATWEGA